MAKLQVKTQNRLILIKRYILSAVNLYGVIPLDRLVEVFNRLENNLTSESEIRPVVELLATIPSLGLSIKDDIIANEYYELNDPKDLIRAKDLIRVQQSKPRYIPDKKTFLNYEDDSFVEPFSPVQDLVNFILKNKLIDHQKPLEIYDDVIEIHDQIVCGYPTKAHMTYFTNRGYQFRDEVEVKLFMGLIINLHNHTRLYENNGYTPVELRELTENVQVNDQKI